MSRGGPPGSQPRPAPFERLGRAAQIAATIVLPAGAAIALLAVATDSAHHVDAELQLVAAAHVRAGEPLPLRAQLFAHVRRPEGPELALAPVEVTLRAKGGAVLARTHLRPSHARSLEGTLLPPAQFHGAARIEARAKIGADAPYAERWVWFDAAGGPLALHARDVAPLQRFAAGAVRAERAQVPPDALDVRVGQGACNPEHACTLFVHVGEPAAALQLVPAASAVPDESSARPSAETTGVVVLRAVTHGPEAQTTLRATRDGQAVATRALRLPVALGVQPLIAPARVMAAPAQPSFGLDGDETGCIADAFLEQRWLHTFALRRCRGEALPVALTPGTWRVQLRGDPFASESASVFTLYVRAAGEDDARALQAIAASAAQRDASDRLARDVSRDAHAFGAGFDATAGYLLASLDEGVVALPEPVSSYPRALERAALERGKLRALGLLVLAACALALGLLVMQRGLRAAAEAGRVMQAAGEEPRALDRQRARMALQVLATVTSLLLAFVAIAVYMIVRGRGP